MIHVSVRHKGMADAQELPRRLWSKFTEIEEQRASPEAKVDEQPRIRKRVIDEARLNEPSHGSSWSLKARLRPGHTLYSDGTGAVCPTLARMDTKRAQLFEKFMVAVDMLATSPASLQKRLEGAYRSLADVESKDFDDKEMQVTFEQIRSRLTRVQHRQTDSIAAACRQMSDQEAAEVADFIFSLFLRIAKKHHSSSWPTDDRGIAGARAVHLILISDAYNQAIAGGKVFPVCGNTWHM
jgi:hypothetical protein